MKLKKPEYWIEAACDISGNYWIIVQDGLIIGKGLGTWINPIHRNLEMLAFAKATGLPVKRPK